ncbi:MAG: UDP-3-O-acyl-N-acetylglucosamine deacetylase [Alphaproteobacteria bacterium]
MTPLDTIPFVARRQDNFRPLPLVMQNTLRGTAQCTGVGVHSGEIVTLKLHPAPADHGIVFVRTDLPAGQNTIPATWDSVMDTRLCTVIGNATGATVGTVEHLLAAMRAMDIDNALVEIDGAEVPIMDGSSAPFVFLIEMAGIIEQDEPRQWIEILKPVQVDLDGKRAALVPGDQSVFNVEILFKSPVIDRQSYDFAVSPAGFKGEISRARTFGFLEEVDQLRKMGLARGGSLHNAIVINGDKIMNEDGLRYHDEFVRHKLLDAIGDLSLAGAPILGSFEGYCTGHALNNKLLRALFADASAWRMVTRPNMDAQTDLAATG